MSFTVIVIIGYGVFKTKRSKDIHGYLLGGNEAKWWTVGLSVMATQASAVTFLSTPGQAYHDGMGFAQFYLMLPVAMIIICITFIPLYYKLKVYTAYQFLEERFDLKTRSLTASLFLIQRGIAAGITIYAPSIVMSTVMGWDLKTTVILIGLISILYTMSGGTKAVHVTHKHQMIVILLSLFVIFFILINHITQDYTLVENLKIAKAADKLEVIDFTFDLNERYNFWSSLAALFLFLSYFGTDQSQVQRYISGRSIKESRLGLIMNGIMKVPLQLFILSLGVLVFLFYQSREAPIFFNSQVLEEVRLSSKANELASLEDTYQKLTQTKAQHQAQYISAMRSEDIINENKYRALIVDNVSQEKKVRAEVKTLIKDLNKSEKREMESNDKDYVFISFILNHLPNGLIGLLLAVIFFAAMSSTASELNALAATTTVDIYKRSIYADGDDAHYVMASKGWTVMWGIIGLVIALSGNLFENLIQFVNIVGSVFYGTILGIFLVGFYRKHIGANETFYAALISQIIVVIVFWIDILPYLWLNVIGVVGVLLFSEILLVIFGKAKS
jgi:SSS family transporter